MHPARLPCGMDPCQQEPEPQRSDHRAFHHADVDQRPDEDTGHSRTLSHAWSTARQGYPSCRYGL